MDLLAAARANAIASSGKMGSRATEEEMKLCVYALWMCVRTGLATVLLW